MTVAEFLERAQHNPIAALPILLDLLQLLDELESESCSILAGKIRAQLKESGELPSP